MAFIQEISKFCSKEFREIMDKNDDPALKAYNPVIQCLRREFARKDTRLGFECRVEIREIIIASELDERLDPPFYKACTKEIGRLCSDKLRTDVWHWSVVECIKSKFYQNMVTDSACQREMERRASEEFADVHVGGCIVHFMCQFN